MNAQRLFVVLIIFLSGILAGCVAPDAAEGERSPYVDQRDGEVRGLSEKEIAELRSGAGMGLARPAELNGYPGPLHVIELADALDLSEAQRAEVQALRAEVVADASRLGEKIIAQHAALEARFRSGEIDEAVLVMELEKLEALYAELRFVHLKAHLDTLPILTQHQRMRYDELRGYAEVGEGEHEGHDGHA